MKAKDVQWIVKKSIKHQIWAMSDMIKDRAKLIAYGDLNLEVSKSDELLIENEFNVQADLIRNLMDE